MEVRMKYRVSLEMNIEGPGIGAEEMESMIEKQIDLLPFNVTELVRVEVTEIRLTKKHRAR
jgi:hypothetical protein